MEALLACLMALASPDNSFSAPTFFPLLGQPVLLERLNIPQDVKAKAKIVMMNVFFIRGYQNFKVIKIYFSGIALYFSNQDEYFT